ncbi:hypothetical protein ACLMJK_008314 [Lecanora helva]
MKLRSGRRTSRLQPRQAIKESSISSKKRNASAIDQSHGKDQPITKRRKQSKRVRWENGSYFPEDQAAFNVRKPRYRAPTPIHSHFPTGLPQEWLGSDDSEKATQEEEDEILAGSQTIKGKGKQTSHQTEQTQPPKRNDSNAPEEAPQPKTNADAEFYRFYLAIKRYAWDWSTKYFPPTSQPLNLLELCESHPQLMEYANYLSACTNKTWEDVFNEQRHLLVYCIIGKTLEVHVFGQELIGGSAQQIEEMRRYDAESIMKDDNKLRENKLTFSPIYPVFFRQTQRSHLVSAFLRDSNSHENTSSPSQPAKFTLPNNIIPTISTLTASLLQMLLPLLPPTYLKQEFIHHLTDILLNASLLSLSLRKLRPSPPPPSPLSPTSLVTYKPAIESIYHLSPHPAIGSLYDPEEMHILDRKSSNSSSSTERRKNRGLESDMIGEHMETQVVTMAGWPSLVWYTRFRVLSDGKMGVGGKGREGRERMMTKVLARAEVVVEWGKAVVVESSADSNVKPSDDSNWLGLSLREEMERRMRRQEGEGMEEDGEERKDDGWGSRGGGVDRDIEENRTEDRDREARDPEDKDREERDRGKIDREVPGRREAKDRQESNKVQQQEREHSNSQERESEERDRQERTAVAGSGLALGGFLAAGWIFQQEWVKEWARGVVGV